MVEPSPPVTPYVSAWAGEPLSRTAQIMAKVPSRPHTREPNLFCIIIVSSLRRAFRPVIFIHVNEPKGLLVPRILQFW